MGELTYLIELLGRLIIGLSTLFFICETGLFDNFFLLCTSILICLWIANPIYKAIGKAKAERGRRKLFSGKVEPKEGRPTCDRCGKVFKNTQARGTHRRYCKGKRRR